MKPLTSKLHIVIIHFTIILSIQFTISLPTLTPTFCGKIQIQTPFLSHVNHQQQQQSGEIRLKTLLSHMLLCKSHSLYLRTSLGLFPISFMDYKAKLLTISSHPFLSTTQNFISPSLLSAGFPSPSQPNSLILVNCTISNHNFTVLHKCNIKYSTCLLVEDSEKLDVGFSPMDLNCSHYMRVYKRSLASLEGNELHGDEFEVGTRISFEITNNVARICEGCEKTNGDCGAGLRCICHARECKDHILNKGGMVNPRSIVLTAATCTLVIFLHYKTLI